ncbi:MAG TPA: F0F1 ATP synthase subunit B [Pirellulales bacterium]|nr:F0F1 ATP synthase subunit B [Pirellulales bacterium]
MHRILIGLIVGVIFTLAGSRATAADEAGHGHGHHQEIGTQGVSKEPSEFKGDLAIFTFIVFLLLLAILWKFAWGPISAGLEKREHGIAEHIAAAQRSHEEAKRLLAEYEHKLASAHDDVRAILDEARRDAAQTHQEILAQARIDAVAEMDRAKREVETARDQALKQLVETSANLAVELAGRIVRAELTPAKHAQLINEVVAKFPKHDPSRN